MSFYIRLVLLNAFYDENVCRPYCVVIHVSHVLVTPSDTQALSNSSILIKIYSVLKLSYIILTIVKDIIIIY